MNPPPNIKYPLKFQVRHQKQTDTKATLKSARFMFNKEIGISLLVLIGLAAVIILFLSSFIFPMGLSVGNTIGAIIIVGIIDVFVFSYLASDTPLRHTIEFNTAAQIISITATYLLGRTAWMETKTHTIPFAKIKSIHHAILAKESALINNCVQLDLPETKPIQLCFGANPDEAKALNKTLNRWLSTTNPTSDTNETNTPSPDLVQTTMTFMKRHVLTGGGILIFLAVIYFFFGSGSLELSTIILIGLVGLVSLALHQDSAILIVYPIGPLSILLNGEISAYPDRAFKLTIYAAIYLVLFSIIAWWSIHQVKTKYADPTRFHNRTAAITQWLFPLLGFGFTAVALLTISLLPQAISFINPFDLTVFGFAFSLAALLSDHKMKPLSYLSTTAALTLFTLQFFV